jgi:hypothetical protein
VSLAFDPDGHTLAAGFGSGAIRLLDMGAGIVALLPIDFLSSPHTRAMRPPTSTWRLHSLRSQPRRQGEARKPSRYTFTLD